MHDHQSQKCRDFMTQFSAYIDAELEAHLCAELEAHLAACTDCRIMLDTTRKTIELYRQQYKVQEIQLPEDVKNRLRQALRRAGVHTTQS